MTPNTATPELPALPEPIQYEHREPRERFTSDQMRAYALAAIAAHEAVKPTIVDSDGMTINEHLDELLAAHKNWGGWSGIPDTVAGIRALAADRAANSLALQDALDRIEHLQKWYGSRFARLFDWAHAELNEQQKTRYFNIVANGTADVMEPPIYAQQLNIALHRAQKAEAALLAVKSLATEPVFEVGLGWLKDARDYPRGTPLYAAAHPVETGSTLSEPAIVWPKSNSVKRRDDMSASDTLQVGIDESGDLQVSLWTDQGYSSVEFCTGGGNGGGKSPNTRLALIALMVAMEADSTESTKQSTGATAP